MHYNSELDKKILLELMNKSIGFNELFKKFPNLPKATLSNHLIRLQDHKLIHRDDTGIGKRRPIKLSQLAETQIRYDLFQGVRTKRNKKIPFKELNAKEKKTTAIRLLIFRVLRRSLRVNQDEQPPSAKLLDGFVIDDLFKSPYIAFGVKGVLFNSQNQVNEYIRILEDEKIIQQQGFYQDKKLYIIPHSELRKFLTDCVIVLQELVRLIEYSWNYGKHRKEKISWYSEVFGSQKAVEMVNDKTNDKINRKEKDTEIKRCLKLLKIYTKEIDNPEYNIKTKYPLLYDIVMKVIKPAFPQKLQDRSNLF